ncbi:MAG: hypothetical protein ACRDM1_10260, partial [Gaiellaceae bacterium]
PLDAAASYLGVTLDVLRTQLAAGKSLADVAAAQSKSVSGLEDALLTDVKAQLGAEVAAGRLTSDQETSALAQAQTRIGEMVDHIGLPPGRDGGNRGGLNDAAAAYLGLTHAQLRAKLDAGQTLAQVAAAQGKSVDGLKDALVTQFRSTLDGVINATHAGGPDGPPAGVRP